MNRRQRTHNAKKRLRNNAGESIAEVLIALLISSLALMILAGMITSTANMITKSKKVYGDYIAAEASLVDYTNSAGSGKVSFKIGDAAYKLTDDSDDITVQYYTPGNDVLGHNKVVSYKTESE